MLVVERHSLKQREKVQKLLTGQGCGLESLEVSFPNMEGSTFIRGASGWSLWNWGDGQMCGDGRVYTIKAETFEDLSISVSANMDASSLDEKRLESQKGETTTSVSTETTVHLKWNSICTGRCKQHLNGAWLMKTLEATPLSPSVYVFQPESRTGGKGEK